MISRKTYLDCVSRVDAEKIWWKELTEAGYFSGLVQERVSVDNALGRVTAKPVYAALSVPHYNGAAVDGVALRAQDTFGVSENAPKTLRILPPHEDYEPGTCYLVDAGDVLPTGTNAVVTVEDVHLMENEGELLTTASPWQNVRMLGEDLIKGEMILSEYHRIRPGDIAALLVAGQKEVEVVKRPKVLVIPTGTELVATAEDLKPGNMLDINSHMLCAAMMEWKSEPTAHSIVGDDFDSLRETILEHIADYDMIVVNAGTSAGMEDFTPKVLESVGSVVVHGVAINPGKAVVLGLCQGKPILGLPGYSVSALLTAELFARPVLLERQKLPLDRRPEVEARMVRQVYSHIGQEEYLRVSLAKVKDRIIAVPLHRGEGIISSFTRAHGMMRIPAGSGGVMAGSHVKIEPLGRDRTFDTLLIMGSHDKTLDIMGMYLRRMCGRKIASGNVGSIGGITAVRNNEAHVAGIHILDEKTGTYNLPYVEKNMAGLNWKLVHLAKREQGFLVRKGNPLQILGLTDLLRPDVRYINRQQGSGTRMLLDHELRRQGLDPKNISGYEQEVMNQMAVAACIVNGAAHAGLGIRAAAQAMDLDFVSVAWEQYDLLFHFPQDEDTEALLLQILRSEEFRHEVEVAGGYDLSASGTIIAEQ